MVYLSIFDKKVFPFQYQSELFIYLPNIKKNFSLYAGKGGRDGMNGDIFFF